MKTSELRAAQKNYLRQVKQVNEMTVKSLNDVEEQENDIEVRLHALLRPENYGTFWNYYLGLSAGGNLGDKACADFHIRAYRQLQRQKNIIQFRIWFRGAGKSLQTNVGNVLALKQRKELKFMLLVGSTELRAKLLLADLQAQLEGNERLIRDFGKQIRYGHWQEGQFETMDGCYFMALGIDQPFRGLRRHANRIDLAVVDDVEDRKVALNPRIVQERVDKITRDLLEACQKDKQRLVISNNLITKEGIVTHLLTRMRGPHIRVSEVPIVDKQGNSKWPAAWSAEDITNKKASTDPFTWSSEYLNKPIERGKIFKNAWIKYVKCGTRAPAGAVCFWDLSYTSTGNYKACAVVGVQANKMLLLDVFCRKCELSEAMDWHFNKLATWRKWGWPVDCYYDATAAQRPVFQPVWMDAMARNKATEVPLPDSCATNKALRIQATLSGYLHNGQLRFSQSLRHEPDMEAAITQLLGLLFGGRSSSFFGHGADDFPDALEAAVRKCASLYLTQATKGAMQPIIGQRDNRRTW